VLDSEPTVISMRCLLADPGAVFPWHSHAFDEFTLVTDDDTVIGYPPGETADQEEHAVALSSRRTARVVEQQPAEAPLSGSCTLHGDGPRDAAPSGV